MKSGNITKLLLSVLLFFAATALWAQSMTENQIIQFVQAEQEKGTSQQQIVSKLFQKGVTTDQLRKARRKYQKQLEQPGAVSQTGVAEQTQANDEYRMRISRNPVNEGKMTPAERRQALSDEVVGLFPDSLDIEAAKQRNKVFGRNIFNNESLTFQPNMNMATPANYRLGAGDNVIIDVWGASQQTFVGTISPDGFVTIDGVGPVKLAGMTVSAANSFIAGKLGQFYSGSNIQLTVGETRSIQVQVMGEVVAPGTYTLSSLSSAFNALYAAGGISEIGTLRDIKVYRQGRVIASVDVYDYILNGNTSGDIRLQDNDIIVVGPYDCLVSISGKVKRPMFYEMKSSESVSTILSYSGGFTGSAYRKNLRLIRKTGSEYSVHTIDEFEMNGFTLNDGDSIYVDSIVATYSNMIELRGAVNHPGMYEVGGSISSVRDLVNAAEGLRRDAFTSRAVLHRTRDDMSLEVLPINIVGIMKGEVPDVPLRKDDILFVPSRTDMRGEETVQITGEVRFPGTFVYADNTSLEDLILQAGGLTEAASMAKVDVFRRLNNAFATEYTEELSQSFTFSLKDGFVIEGEQGFVLQPFDVVAVRKSPAYNVQQQVNINGSVNFPGAYAMLTKNYRLSDLVKAAGGLNSLGYAKGARLERRMTPEEREQQLLSLRTAQIALYEESMQGENKNFDLNRADSLLQMKLDMGSSFPVAIDLDKALANPGGDDDIVLREGDNLVVPKYSSTVKISGDVMQPISMNYKKGESLKYYINHAGGYGDNARKSRVYAIYMNGSVELLSHTSKKAVQPGCTIVVPSKKNKQKMTTAEYAAMGTSAASIATMMVTIANILK